MATLSGTVKDLLTGAVVQGITVTEQETGLHVSTNASGVYSLVTSNSGNHTLLFTRGRTNLGGFQVSNANAASAVTMELPISTAPLSGPNASGNGSLIEGRLAQLMPPGDAAALLASINAGAQAAADLVSVKRQLANLPALGANQCWSGVNKFIGTMLSGWGNGLVPTAQQPTVKALEMGGAGLHQTVLTFVNALVPISDNAGVTGYGSLNVYNFPPANLLYLGGLLNATVGKDALGVSATFRSTVSVGTVAANNTATLTSTEANLIPSTANPQAVAGASTCPAKSTTTQGPVVIDGTTTTTTANGLNVYLNFLVNSADETVGTTPTNLVLNGVLVLSWVNLGDL